MLRGFEINLYESALFKSGATLQLIQSLTPFVAAPRWDVVAQGWFGSCTFEVRGSLDLLQWLYDIALEYHVEVVDPYLSTRYEGFISRLVLFYGGGAQVRALDEMWNEVRVKYGEHQFVQDTDAASQAQWGEKRKVMSVGSSRKQHATRVMNRFLDEHKDPHGDVGTELGSGANGEIKLQVTCRGYWEPFKWSNYRANARSMDSGKQIRRIVSSFNAVHGFCATDTGEIALTGVPLDSDARGSGSAQERMSKLMNAGDSSNLRMFGGVGPGRKFFTFPRPTQVDYFYDPYETEYRDLGGAILPKWEIEPGHFICLQTPFPAPQPGGDPLAYPDTYDFVWRVAYDLATDHVQLENPDGISILRVMGRNALR